MNFFEAQDQARRTTRRLLLLFILAVISLILLAELLFISVLFYGEAPEGVGLATFAVSLEPAFHFGIVAIIVLVIVLGTLYKSRQLSAGGHVVAEMMDGQLIPGNSPDLQQQKLLNIVEEMAIASGVPVPPVYIQTHERAINAFAAGLGTDDAIICVTQGAVEALDRDALQGVIAHEFSHILNGDMRMNIMITSILHGVLLLGLIGSRMLRHLSYRRSSARNKGGAIMLIGIGLMAIGFGGSLFGNIIKATLNRQREYLADASAVQFTRNPHSIAAALKAIGGYLYGSRLRNPNGAEISHFLFASGAVSWLDSVFATHPPLRQRILRLEPDWDGNFPKVSTSYTQKTMTEELLDGSRQPQTRDKSHLAVAIAVGDAITRLEQFGTITPAHIHDARGLIAAMPAALKAAARDPYHARALVYALLLSSDQGERERQCGLISAQAEPGVDEKLLSLYTILTAVGRETWLPLVEMALPALQSCSPAQIGRFQRVMNRLIHADRHVSLFEWCLATLVNNSLSSSTAGVLNQGGAGLTLERLQLQARVILSLLARTGVASETAGQQAFAAALDFLGYAPETMYTATDLRFETATHALQQMDRLLPLEKKRFLDACLVLARSDLAIEVPELEIIRAIAAAIHCPMPPLMPDVAAGEGMSFDP